MVCAERRDQVTLMWLMSQTNAGRSKNMFREAAEKIASSYWQPEGANQNAALAASPKRCPDTHREFFSSI
jgi:hypothetical protein